MAGKLFVVSTPIGNLEDITLRALAVLADCGLIACEDTRTTRKLLSRHGIGTPVTSYHEHNETAKSPRLLERLKDGEDVALVSDAGTPSVSDPGWRLVNLSVENGIEVVPVPGPSAVLSALVVSGLAVDSFLFLGFFPKAAGRRKELLKRVKSCPHTLIFYESARRLPGAMKVLLEILGERKVCVAREMTKLYEEMIRGTVPEVISVLSQREPLKGEVTVVVQGCGEEIPAEEVREALLAMKERGAALSDAVREVSARPGLSRNSVYRTALEIWEK